MKEIKFRAWDGKKMIDNVIPWQWDYVLSRGWWQCLENKSESESVFRLSGFKFKELMQFTGLKDKNGKEIWEGDIFRINISDGNNGMFVVSDINRILLKDGMFCFEEDGSLFPISQYSSFCEVIGNIYENPELVGK